MNEFYDAPVRTACQAECDKRNKHISKTHPHRWKPLWNSERGWYPALRPHARDSKNAKSGS